VIRQPEGHCVAVNVEVSRWRVAHATAWEAVTTERKGKGSKGKEVEGEVGVRLVARDGLLLIRRACGPKLDVSGR